MPNKIPQEEFIIKCKLRHDDFYLYENTTYINSSTPIIITCPIHGEFKQIASIHLKSHGCKSCMLEKLREDRKLSNEEIILKFNKKHNFKYDYSLMEYTGLNSS